jgi:digeranylgeranylglycerophospholipid reductase
LGVQQKSLDNFNRNNGTHKNLKTLIDEYVRINPVFKQPQIADSEDDSGNGWGTWQVSVRRQNDCMVANGYMLVGDSAWMPKPLDAGGIGPAIIAATLAGKHAVNAIESRNYSETSLWSYNKDFIDCYGYKTAGLEVFRRMLQGLNNDQINYGMKHFLSKFDIDKITNGEHPEFSMVDKVSLFVRGAINKKLADDLRHTAEVNKKLVAHYHNYPDVPEKFIAWENDLLRYIDDAMLYFERP